MTIVNFYDEDTIWSEKTKFFEAVGKKAISRRANDRVQRNVEDIINEIEKCAQTLDKEGETQKALFGMK